MGINAEYMGSLKKQLHYQRTLKLRRKLRATLMKNMEAIGWQSLEKAMDCSLPIRQRTLHISLLERLNQLSYSRRTKVQGFPQRRVQLKPMINFCLSINYLLKLCFTC